jgi:hypothetical protein
MIKNEPKHYSLNVLPPLIALSLLATLMPLPRPPIASSIPWKVELLASVILAIIGIAVLSTRRGALGEALDRRTYRVAVAFSAFILWSLASATWASSPYSALHHSFVWFTYLLFFLAAAFHLSHNRSAKIVTDTFIWFTLMIGVLCLLDYLTLTDFRSLEGLLRIRYGKYAELLATILPLIWVAAMYARRRIAFLWMTGAGAVGWLVVMLSLSKGAFIAGSLGFFLAGIGCLFFSFRTFRKRVIISFSIWLLLTVSVQAGFSFLSSVPSTTEYITGNADASRETTLMRVFTWKAAEQMFKDNWLSGVGADNFGVSFNAARKSFREEHAADTTSEFGEDYLIERAHNEPLQIAGELGSVGVVLLAIPFLLIGIWMFQSFRARHQLSPALWACVGGTAAFAVSSCLSSFSFRAAQNGIVYFLVLAVGLNELKKVRAGGSRPVVKPKLGFLSRWALPATLAVLSLQIMFFSAKAVSEYIAIEAQRTSDHDAAIKSYALAYRLDPDNPGLMIPSASRSAASGDFQAAAAKMSTAINKGLGVPTTYSTLAGFQMNAGSAGDAERTLGEAIKIFPRSVFLRTRFAVMLEDSGKYAQADLQMRAAANIDCRQSAGWYNLFRKGGLAAFLEGRDTDQAALPAELMPQSIVPEFLNDKVQVSQR